MIPKKKKKRIFVLEFLIKNCDYTHINELYLMYDISLSKNKFFCFDNYNWKLLICRIKLECCKKITIECKIKMPYKTISYINDFILCLSLPVAFPLFRTVFGLFLLFDTFWVSNNTKKLIKKVKNEFIYSNL